MPGMQALPLKTASWPGWYAICSNKGRKTEKSQDMKKEKVYNEAVSGDEGFAPGDGYPSCDGEPCANVSDETDEATDTLADGEPAAEADAAKALEEAVAQWQDKYVRLQAEFDNYRKRTLKEKMDLVQTGGRDVLLEKSDDLEALRAGVTLISQKFTEALRRKGVTEIEVLDKEFDADFSEAVARFAAGDEKKGKVIDVVQTGYMLGEKVLRFAKVVVGE